MCLHLRAAAGLLRGEYSAFSASVLQPPGRAPSLQEGTRESITLFKTTQAHQQAVVLQKRRGNVAAQLLLMQIRCQLAIVRREQSLEVRNAACHKVKRWGCARASLALVLLQPMEQGDRTEKNKREDRWSQRGETEEISQILKGKTSSGKAKAPCRGECCCLAEF